MVDDQPEETGEDEDEDEDTQGERDGQNQYGGDSGEVDAVEQTERRRDEADDGE